MTRPTWPTSSSSTGCSSAPPSPWYTPTSSGTTPARRPASTITPDRAPPITERPPMPLTEPVEDWQDIDPAAPDIPQHHLATAPEDQPDDYAVGGLCTTALVVPPEPEVT